MRSAACRSCAGEIETAGKPNGPIAKCLAAPGLLAHVIVSKFDDHLPLYRQEEILKRNGIEINRSTIREELERFRVRPGSGAEGGQELEKQVAHMRAIMRQAMLAKDAQAALTRIQVGWRYVFAEPREESHSSTSATKAVKSSRRPRPRCTWPRSTSRA